MAIKRTRLVKRKPDAEWVLLLWAAKRSGLAADEVRRFLKTGKPGAAADRGRFNR